ncbi:O-antigen polymerase [Flavobacterium sp. WC2429]|uniref:O-antigen polymerase n=1 Tax=Flavobacterium sp. WC2429 TaxID=3234140 RepID=A0AB39WLI6_9FLAO
MKTRWFTNPIWVYSWIWILVMLVYNLGWSNYYNNLSVKLVSFFVVTFFLSFLGGYILETKNRNKFKKIQTSDYNLIMLLFLWGGYILEFLYSGGIPLVLVLKGSFGNYKDFTGIPTFHVILASYTIFLGVYFYHQFVSTNNNKKLLLFLILSILPNLLVLNRGAIMITLISGLIIYLMKQYIVRINKIIKIVLGILIVLFLFGQLGNMRNELSADSKEYILSLGGATDEFIYGNVPFEYYWGYLYIASPLGNLDNIINTYDPKFDIYNVPNLMFEFTPDFISNRLRSIFNDGEVEDISSYLVVESLNAPTVYFRSYFLLGWAGIWAMFIFSMFSTICYLFILPTSGKYYLTGLGILTSIIILNTFSNMWVSSGTVLIWPLIFSLFDKIKVKNNV